MDKNSFYKPTGNVKESNRTYVPDLYRQVAAEMLAEEDVYSSESDSAHIIRVQDRPLIGVLYSISAGIEGELFPVYIGRNSIGSDLSCDICLRETSVSAQHGTLLARKQMNENGDEYINVILSDNNSSYGTSVNGEKLNFEKVTCSDGDIIAFGQNYVLVLSLFNAINKLSVAYGFEKIPESPKEKEPTTELLNSQERIIGGGLMSSEDNHSTNITQDIKTEASVDFYKPTKQPEQDHYNNKTIIL